MDLLPCTITVTNPHGDPLYLELHPDADIGEWMHVFRAVLYWLTFDIKLIKENLGELE